MKGLAVASSISRPATFAAVVLAAACGPSPQSTPTRPPAPVASDSAPAAQVPTLEPVARASVGLLHEGEGETRRARLDVTLDVPLGWVSVPYQRLRVRFREERFRERDRGYASFVVRSDGAEWHDELPKPSDDRLTLRYTISLTHHEADPVVGVDEVPHPTRGGWFLNGRAILPAIAIVTADGTEKAIDLAAELSLKLPIGWRLESSADATLTPPNPRNDHPGPYVLRASSLADLKHAFYYTGRFESVEAEYDGVGVRIVTSDFAARDLGPLETLIRRTLELGEQKLGPLPAQRLLVTFDRHAERAGGVVGRGISLLHPEAPDGRASSPLGLVVVHELLHLWNRAEPWWLNEGFTRYFELGLSARLDRQKPEVVAERLLGIHAAYARGAAGTRIVDARDAQAYAAGAVLAFCLDGRLRASGASLFEVHRLARTRGKLGPIDPRVLRDAIREHSEADAAYLDRLLTATGPVDFGACLSQAGYRSKVTTYRGITPEALALKVLGIRGHDTASATVLRADPGAPLRAGDRIDRVDGAAVTRMEDLAFILRAKKPGAGIVLDVQRGVDRARVVIEMPALTAAERPRLARYAIDKAPETGPLLD